MLEKPSDNAKLGELLVRNGLISEGQLQHALLVQQVQAVYKPLGEVCKDLGYISRTDLRQALDRYRKRIPLGSLLLKIGVITDLELQTALASGRFSEKRLGEVLVKKKLITQSALSMALAIQLTLPTIAPDPILIDTKLLHTVNAKFLYQKKVLPVRYNKDEGVLTVIMENPLDVETVADLEKIFKTGIEPAILASGEIKDMLDALLDPWSKVSSVAATGDKGLQFYKKADDELIIEFA